MEASGSLSSGSVDLDRNAAPLMMDVPVLVDRRLYRRCRRSVNGESADNLSCSALGGGGGRSVVDGLGTPMADTREGRGQNEKPPSATRLCIVERIRGLT